jgi:ribose transport system ATP-binding protein
MPRSSAGKSDPARGVDTKPPAGDVPAGGERPVVLRACAITKEFAGVRALRGVDVALRAGEVHALLGENGAGKSTLIKTLAGLHQPTSGHIELDGREVVFPAPADSQRAGISVIAQELELVGSTNVVENIFLGHELRRGVGFLDKPRMRRVAADLLEQLGVDVRLTAPVESLSVADQQLVEIAKALSIDFRILILDEPTAALNATDVERLFEVLGRLREHGVAMLYVSHRLREVKQIADRVTVFRDGSVVGGGPVADFSEDTLAELIVGRAVSMVEVDHDAAPDTGNVALQVKGLRVPGAFEDIDLDVHYGEVVGVAGLVGSGRAELSHAIVGSYPSMAGSILIDGRPANIASPRDALADGVVFLSEDRKAEGGLPDLTVRENVMVGRERHVFRVIHAKRETEEYEQIRERLRIHAESPNALITSLSGGNQQRVLVGRALLTGGRVLVLNDPTRGVDIGARAEIHQIVRQLAADGFAVLVSSSDVPELVSVSDRCLVLSAGRAVCTLRGAEIDEPTIVQRALAPAAMAAA